MLRLDASLSYKSEQFIYFILAEIFISRAIAYAHSAQLADTYTWKSRAKLQNWNPYLNVIILDILFKSEMGSKIRKIDTRENNVKLRLCYTSARTSDWIVMWAITTENKRTSLLLFPGRTINH